MGTAAVAKLRSCWAVDRLFPGGGRGRTAWLPSCERAGVLGAVVPWSKIVTNSGTVHVGAFGCKDAVPMEGGDVHQGCDVTHLSEK